VFTAQSLLFVPGHRPDRFAKAKAAGAGVTVIDLEDAVPAADKAAARSAALAEFGASAEGNDLAGWALRINAVTTAAGIADLASLLQAAVLPALLLVPMVEDAIELKIVANALGARCPGLIPLIETPAGLRRAHRIGCMPRVAALMFGGGDFSAELGVALGWESLLAARGQFVMAAAEARVPAIDVPFLGLDDADGLMTETRRARALGFAAKAAIHPAQLPPIHAAFAPTPVEVAEASEALAAYAAGGGQAIRFKGRMLEAPIIRRYQAILDAKDRMHHA
jgi:citrate lyase subunit beta/citryl-CoA lyase/(S)-citramalyl-CoA lyase